jgi:hypothetical protein
LNAVEDAELHSPAKLGWRRRQAATCGNSLFCRAAVGRHAGALRL